MQFAQLPKTISFNDLIAHKNKSLSPSDHTSIKVNSEFKYLEEFISKITYGKEVGGFNYVELSKYKFIRTKCLQYSSILLDLEESIGINPLSFRQFNLSTGDVLIVKDSNVGEVCYLDEDLPNYSISGGVVKIKLKGDFDKFYIIGIMKSSFFKEQIDLMTPKGATIKHSKDSFKYAKIPIPSNEVCQKVSVLTQSLIEKERELRNKFQSINTKIEEELRDNQEGKEFSYKSMTYKDLLKYNRFDTGLYTEKFKEIEHLIYNYKNGSDTITNLGFYSIRGQNLAVSVIGKSLYADSLKPNLYELFLPTNITVYGTIKKVLFIGNSKKLLLVDNEDIIFGAEGFEKGRSFIPLAEKGKFITNIHGTMLRSDTAPIYQKIFIKCMLDWFREKEVIDAYSVGGNGGSFSTKYWKILHFPLFDDEKQKEIAKLYYNPNDDYLNHILKFDFKNYRNIDSVVTRNSGILDLDSQIKAIKNIIDGEITKMISS